MIKGGVPPGATARALVEPGKAAAIYLRTRTDRQVNSASGTKPPSENGRAQVSPAALELELPSGRWKAEWIDTKTGATAREESFQHGGGPRQLAVPEYTSDIALRLRKSAD